MAASEVWVGKVGALTSGSLVAPEVEGRIRSP